MDKPVATSKPGKTLLPQWTPPLVLCVIAARVASLVYDRAFSSYDDGVAAEGAKLVLSGKIPYRDFWTMYGPGTFYANAFGLAVLGERLISIRILGLLQAPIQALLLYMILKRTVRGMAAILTVSLVFLALIPIGTLAYWFTILLAAVYCLIRAIERPDRRWAYCFGLLTGLQLLFRQDVGVYLAIAGFPLIYASAPGRAIHKLAPMLRALAAAAVLLAAAIGYFAAKGAIVPMIADALRFALVDYPGSRPLPYPVPWHDVMIIGKFSAPVSIAFLYQLYGFYLMPAILVGLCALSIRRSAKDPNKQTMQLVCLACIGLIMFTMVNIRPSGARIVASALLGTVALAALTADKNRAIRAAAGVGLLISLAAFAPFAAYTSWAHQSYAPSAIADRGGVFAAGGHAECLSLVSSQIRKLTSPTERILCGAPVIYFLSDRQPVTRYYEPHPHMTEAPAVQRTIISDIETNHMRFFVRSREWGRESYFTIESENQPKSLIKYIENNYRIREDYVLFQIYERKTPSER